jgi:glycerol uptake operon antiterminator
MKNTSTGTKTISYALKNKPVITSIVSEEDLTDVLGTSSNIVFLLTGNIFTLKSITEQIQEAGKLMFVHFDLVEGLGRDAESVRYLAEVIGIDGLVTTRSNIIMTAQKLGLITVQRLFVFDSVSLENGIRIIKSSSPDAIEVLPGIVISRVIKKLREEMDLPVIAGGLMSDIEDVQVALASGAIGISTSSKELWDWQDRHM